MCRKLALTVCSLTIALTPTGDRSARAQSPDAPINTFTFGADQKAPYSLRDALGRACMNVKGKSILMPASANNTFEHHVVAENSCAKAITVMACYKNSTQCVKIRVKPYKIEDAILGYMPNTTFFVLTFTEAYDP